jgi:hypothetical protein
MRYLMIIMVSFLWGCSDAPPEGDGIDTSVEDTLLVQEVAEVIDVFEDSGLQPDEDEVEVGSGPETATAPDVEDPFGSSDSTPTFTFCTEYLTTATECREVFRKHGKPSRWWWSVELDCCTCMYEDCGSPCGSSLDCEGSCAVCGTDLGMTDCYFHEDDAPGFCTPGGYFPGGHYYLDKDGEVFQVISG